MIANTFVSTYNIENVEIRKFKMPPCFALFHSSRLQDTSNDKLKYRDCHHRKRVILLYIFN